MHKVKFLGIKIKTDTHKHHYRNLSQGRADMSQEISTDLRHITSLVMLVRLGNAWEYTIKFVYFQMSLKMYGNSISDAGHDELAVLSENNVFNSLQQQSNCGSHKGFQETTHGKKAKKIAARVGNKYIISQDSMLQKYKCISCACKKLFGKLHTPEF